MIFHSYVNLPEGKCVIIIIPNIHSFGYARIHLDHESPTGLVHLRTHDLRNLLAGTLLDHEIRGVVI